MPKGRYKNSGGVWKNTRKKSGKHPDCTGQGVMDCPQCDETAHALKKLAAELRKSGGPNFAAQLEEIAAKSPTIEFWIAGWWKDSKNGKYLAEAFTPKSDKIGPSAAERATFGESPGVDDDPPVEDDTPF